jgi:nucleolar protein 4
LNFIQHETARRAIDLLNNNQHVFGPNRRPIVQFAIENRQALQLKEQRLERVRAKQELLKNPTNKTLAFESEKKKKRQQSNVFDPTKKKVRLSELVEQDQDPEDQTIVKTEPSDNSIDFTNPDRAKKRKRPKTKAKREIRDNVDRMIDTMRNKPQLPQRTKKKWFE